MFMSVFLNRFVILYISGLCKVNVKFCICSLMMVFIDQNM
jgi:hypothetical protein